MGGRTLVCLQQQDPYAAHCQPTQPVPIGNALTCGAVHELSPEAHSGWYMPNCLWPAQCQGQHQRLLTAGLEVPSSMLSEGKLRWELLGSQCIASRLPMQFQGYAALIGLVMKCPPCLC